MVNPVKLSDIGVAMPYYYADVACGYSTKGGVTDWEFFAVWDYIITNKAAIYGQRISKEGAKIGVNMQLVTSGVPKKYEYMITKNKWVWPLDRVVIAYNGTKHLVVWSNWDKTNGYYISGQFISPKGAKLGTNFVIHKVNHDDFLVRGIASDGNNFFVVYVEKVQGKNLWNIKGLLLDNNGKLTKPVINIAEITPIIDGQNTILGDVSTAYGNNHYFTVWEKEVHKHILGRCVNKNGAFVSEEFKISMTGTVASKEARCPDVASNGNIFFVVWQEYRGTPSKYNWEIVGAYIEPPYNHVISAVGKISKATFNHDPSVAFSKFGVKAKPLFLVAWQCNDAYGYGYGPNYLGKWYGDLYGQYISEAEIKGNITPKNFPIRSNSKTEADVNVTSGVYGYYAVWYDEPDTNKKGWDVYGALVPKTGCFIASAAYGSELASEVQFLRQFRDNTLKQSVVGSSALSIFENLYYRFAPFLARKIAPSATLRTLTRFFVADPIVKLLSFFLYMFSSEARARFSRYGQSQNLSITMPIRIISNGIGSLLYCGGWIAWNVFLVAAIIHLCTFHHALLCWIPMILGLLLMHVGKVARVFSY